MARFTIDKRSAKFLLAISQLAIVPGENGQAIVRPEVSANFIDRPDATNELTAKRDHVREIASRSTTQRESGIIRVRFENHWVSL